MECTYICDISYTITPLANIKDKICVFVIITFSYCVGVRSLRNSPYGIQLSV